MCHFQLENRTGQAETLSLSLDGKPVLNAVTLAPRESRSFDLGLGPQWHKLELASAGGAHQQTVLKADREKWILIRRELAKAEGFGVHITEYPRHGS